MLGFGKEKERPRFYLLPGQGGRAARRKHRRILMWSIAVALVASALFVGAMFLLNRPISMR